MATVKAKCVCRGRNSGCVICNGLGSVVMPACRRCNGTGRTGAVCVDCQGRGWRELDRPVPLD